MQDEDKSREELLEELRVTRAVLGGAEEALLRAREVLGRRLQVPEAERNEADRLFRVFAEHSRDLICICDLRGLRTYVSPSYRAVLGYEPEELLGESILSLAHPQDFGSVAGELQEGLGEVEPGMFRTRSRHADGRYLWLEAQVSPLLDKEGKVAGGLVISRDVTERMAFEESLRASEEEYRNLVEKAGAGVVSIDLEGRFDYVNPTFREMLGYAESELIGRHFADFLFPDDLQEVMAVFDNALAAPEGRFGLEFRVVHKDGGIVHCYTNPTATRFEGETVGFQAMIQDITPRVQAEREVRESRELLDTLLENAPASIYINSADDRYLMVNRAWEQFTGKQRRQVLGKSPGEVFSPAFARRFEEENQRIKRDRDTLEFDEEVGFSGIRSNFHTVKYPICDEAGRVAAVGGISIDVTGRKRVEEALRQSEERFRAMVEAAPMVAIVSIGVDEIVEYVNPRFTELFGYTIEDIPDAGHWWPLAYPDEKYRRKVAREWTRRVKAAEKAQSGAEPMETIVTCGDGSMRVIEFNMVNTGEKNIVFGTDLTERQRYQKELEASEKSLRALAARLQEAREEERTAIALDLHDQLGQALTGLKIDLAWLRRHLPKDRDAWREKMESMSGLLDSTVRDVRRISADLRPSLLDDFGLVPAMEWLAQDFFERTGVHCRLVAEPEDLDLEKGVSTALYRVVQESLTNVARHAAATRVSVKLKRKEKELVLEVSDNGAGIPEEKIGDQFSLGLLGIRERVTGLGGKLKIAGKEGKGTRVTVHLPLPSAAPGRPDQGREDG